MQDQVRARPHRPDGHFPGIGRDHDHDRDRGARRGAVADRAERARRPWQTLDKALRTARPFVVPHFEINDAVMAEEVQNVRAWGSETEMEMVIGKVADRQASIRSRWKRPSNTPASVR
jgi:hypothetical protein